MDRSPKCPRCSASIDVKADALPKNEWPMDEWPIYKCSSCQATLEKSSKNALYEVFGVVIVIVVAQILGGAVGYLVSGGNELFENIVRWGAMGVGLLWLALKPMRLVERGYYAKQH